MELEVAIDGFLTEENVSLVLDNFVRDQHAEPHELMDFRKIPIRIMHHEGRRECLYVDGERAIAIEPKEAAFVILTYAMDTVAAQYGVQIRGVTKGNS